MDMFVSQDEIVRWETSLQIYTDREQSGQLQSGFELLDLLLKLAWHLLERDTSRAMKLGLQAETCLSRITAGKIEHDAQLVQLTDFRLLLLRLEQRWLFSDFETVQNLTRQALAESRLLSGYEGVQACYDLHYLRASIAQHRGEVEVFKEALAQCIVCAEQNAEQPRIVCAQTLLMMHDLIEDVARGSLLWSGTFSAEAETPVPLFAKYAYLTWQAFSNYDFGNAAAYGMQLYEAYLQSGQIRRAIYAACNVGDAFNCLNDHQSALEWLQIGNQLARRTAWPSSLSYTMIQMAETLRRLRHFTGARDLLQEAMPLLVAGSNSHTIAIGYLGDVLLDMQDYPAALDGFTRLYEVASTNHQITHQILALRGSAHALSMLDDTRQAFLVASQALQLSRSSGDNLRMISVLQVLASIHLRHHLPDPEQSACAALECLEQAFETASTIPGFTVPGELLTELADAYVCNGNHQAAFKYSRMAILAFQKNHDLEIANRITAVQVSHATERMRAESEHLKQLSKVNAERVEALTQSNGILQRLSIIGQEITASLDLETVFQALNEHAHSLLHVTAFVIYLLDQEQTSMTAVYGVENSLPIEFDTIQMSNTLACSVRCVLQKSEIFIELAEGEVLPVHIQGTEQVHSLLFGPLIVADKVLGVMTIQSSKQHAYGEREKIIFRSLCAYGAIALGNADTYYRLKQTQKHLLAQEKFAELGALVAGVAHEINTPIGNCLLIANTLQDNNRSILQKLATERLRRSELSAYCADIEHSAAIMLRGLSSAANLISSFKRVAVDRTSEQVRLFDLQQMLQDIVATLSLRIRHSGHKLHLQVQQEIIMYTLPGALGQVISNLIENAIFHAFENAQQGEMHLSAVKLQNVDQQGQVVITFSDNGTGISSANLEQIFEPFFTTKLGKGGSGLGLNISKNIVNKLLQGELLVQSTLGSGTVFTLVLPCQSHLSEQS